MKIHYNGRVRDIKYSNFHIHLTGSIPFDDIRSIADTIRYDIRQYEPLENYLNFNSPNIWAAAKEITSTQDGLLYSIESIIYQQKKQNVAYIELTINPYGMVRRGLEPRIISDTVNEAYTYASKIGVQFRVKYGINRKDPIPTIDIVKKVYDSTLDKIRVGIDLNGDEHKYPTHEFVGPFLDLKKDKVPTIIHAGEFIDQVKSLEDALRAEPYRLAHAIASVNQSDLLDHIVSNNIAVEVAPTSNNIRRTSYNAEINPLIIMHNKGASLLVGTDDQTFFGNDIAKEYQRLKTMGMDDSSIAKIQEQSIVHQYI